MSRGDRAGQQRDGLRGVAAGEFRPRQDDEGAGNQPGVADPLAQGQGVRELADRLPGTDVLEQVVEPQVPVDLRAAVGVAAFLDGLGQADRRPQVAHRGRPVAAQHLEHQAHVEQRPPGARGVAGLPPQGQGPDQQFLFHGDVRFAQRAARGQRRDVAQVTDTAQPAERASLARPVARARRLGQCLAEQPLRRGELPGAERRVRQRLIARRVQPPGFGIGLNRHGWQPNRAGAGATGGRRARAQGAGARCGDTNTDVGWCAGGGGPTTRTM